MGNTVDGRNPAPLNWLFIPLFIAFLPSQVVPGSAGFLPSTVCSSGDKILGSRSTAWQTFEKTML